MKLSLRWAILVFLLLLGLASSGFQRSDKDKAKGKEKEQPVTEEQELAMGKQLYETTCKMCHKADGKGTLEEMDLTDSVWNHGSTPEEVEKVIREGIKGTGMRAIMGDHSDQQIKALVKYVLKFSAKAPGDAPAEPAKPAVPPDPPATPVPPARPPAR